MSDFLKIGQVIETFGVLRKVGEGGMGEVYEAWDDVLKRKVAIKILSPKNLTDEVSARFRSEGRLLARLRHANVVNLYSVGEHDNLPYMAMEYIDGTTLDNYMKRPCGLKTILNLFRQMLAGLEAAHREHIIHRDIKPSNIMITSAHDVKIVDFGIAKSHTDTESPLTQHGQIVGTKAYLAPELMAGKVASAQSDIYSLGLVLKFMLSGEIPRGEQPGPKRPEPSPKAGWMQMIPPELREILTTMTQRSPEFRYRECGEILADLERVSFESLHPDLLIENEPDLEVENIDAIFKQCREMGLGVAESRMAIGLAAKMETPSTHASDDKTQKIQITTKIILDEQKLNAAVQRIQAAKSTVIANNVLAASIQNFDHIPVQRSRGSRFLLLVTAIIGAFYIGSDPSGFVTKMKNMPATVKAAFNVREKISAKTPALAQTPPAQLPASSAPRPPDSTSMRTPSSAFATPNPGQTFKYRYRLMNSQSETTLKEERVQWELTSVSNGKMFWQDENGGIEIRTTTPYVPPLERSGNFFEGPEKNVPLSEMPMLLAGQSATVKFRNIPARGPASEQEWHCKAGEETPTATPAGSFRATRVECANPSTPGQNEILYYSPQIKNWIIREKNFLVGGQPRRLMIELTGFSLVTH